MPLGTDRNAINVRGGNQLMIRELSPTPTNVFSNLGLLQQNTLADEHSMVDSMVEAGHLVNTQSGQRKVTWTAVLKQSTIDEINLLRNARGKFYEVYYQVVLQNGRIQEYNLPLCIITPSVNLNFQANSERTISVVIIALAPKANATRSGETQFNVTANEPYIITEGTTAFGAPEDSASTLANTIL